MTAITGPDGEVIGAVVACDDEGLMAHETPNHPGYKYFVLYGDHAEWFVCMADDATHAAEQCWDYTEVPVHAVFRGEQDDSWLAVFPSVPNAV